MTCIPAQHANVTLHRLFKIVKSNHDMTSPYCNVLVEILGLQSADFIALCKISCSFLLVSNRRFEERIRRIARPFFVRFVVNGDETVGSPSLESNLIRALLVKESVTGQLLSYLSSVVVI